MKQHTLSYILALDQGTTSSRAVLFDHLGQIVASAHQEFPQIYPSPGLVEHDPETIWETQYHVAQQVCQKARVDPNQIAAIGITNQRETTVVWDKRTGQPIYNAIVWQDRRGAEQCDQLRHDGLEPLFYQKTGLILDSYFSATKLHWILNQVEGAMEQAQQGHLAFGTIDSWLVWKLTDGRCHLIEITNASRTLLYNIHQQCWDEELLKLLNIPSSILPEVRTSSEVYAHTSERLFGQPIPIAGIAGDQQAALFGQCCHRPGMVKNTFGTGCFMLLNTGKKAYTSQHKLLTTIAWKIGSDVEYALEGSVFIGGAVVQWLRDELNIISTAAEVEQLAASVEDNHDVYLVPAFTGLGTPHWDPYARGTIIGITRGTNKGHIARAALESIAYQVADVLEAMQADSGIDIQELRADGGASVNQLLMQFQADILGIEIKLPKITEITALGAAYLAGLAVGFWKDIGEVEAMWQEAATFRPHLSPEERQRLRHRWQQALECAKGWTDTDNEV